MRSRDFCYWLRGYLEISECHSEGLTAKQLKKIDQHLELVFKNETSSDARKAGLASALVGGMSTSPEVMKC